MAHRAGALNFLEQSIPAFKHCFEEACCEFAEIDLRMTKDGSIIVFHDVELTRIFGKDLLVKDSIYPESFKNPKPEIRLHFNYQKTLKTIQSVDLIGKDEPIAPLFRDLLLQFPSRYFNVDIKDQSLECINKVVQIVKETGSQNRVNIGCVNGKMMSHVRRSLKVCSFWASGDEIRRVFVALLLGFLPYIDLNFDTFMPPYVDDGFLQWETKEPYVKNSKFMLFLFRALTWLAPVYYPHLTKRGIAVIPWVVNTKEAMKKLVKLGATGVISDDTDLMRQVVTEEKVLLDKMLSTYKP